MRSNVVLLLFLILFAADLQAEPLRVLLLGYHDPIEHDVLLSHLCVVRCSEANGCPAELIRDGVDYFSDDFIVYRPQYLGQNARFVVDVYKHRNIDLLSFSGHHASGFSGEYGLGRFETERLGEDLADLEGAERFFTRPTLVMLHGCRTDVKSRFAGDPLEYVLHVIHDTQVRENDFERLMAAVQQIGGVQEAYRDLFPNACILGYAGTQTPGGLLEIYGQVNGWLRGLAAVRGNVPPRKFDVRSAYRSRSNLADVHRRIERECRGWPCNLCASDSATYTPLKNALVGWLRDQQRRAHQDFHVLPDSSRRALESSFERTSFYPNSSWSCSVKPPTTAPVWPDPVDESPFGRLFVQLLLLDFDKLPIDQQRQLRAELVHRLGRIAFAEIDQIELRAWLHGEPQWERFWSFVRGPLLDLSTFRQRDLFAFLASLECRDCFHRIFTGELPAILRENAASQLRPSLGEAVYGLALKDPHPRVRHHAAERISRSMDRDLLLAASHHADPEVRRLAVDKLKAPEPPVEPVVPAADRGGR